MGLPSPGRAVAGYLVLSVLVAGLFAGTLVDEDPTGAVVTGAAVAVFGSLYSLQAGFRLRHVLAEFASQVPDEPTPDQNWLNDQSLSWDDPRVDVEGSTSARGLRLSKLTIEAAGNTRYRSPLRAREAARETLVGLDRQPALDTWSERLPSPDPVHSAVRTMGFFVAFVPGVFLFAGVVLDGAVLGLALGSSGVVLVGLAGLGRWLTLRRFRTGFRTLDEGLSKGGIRTRWIDFQGGLVRPRYRLQTDEFGTVVLEGTGHPWGTVEPALESVETARLPDLTECGVAVADALRQDPVYTEFPERPPLSVNQRGAFAAVGTVFAVFGAGLLVSGPSVAFTASAVLAILAGVVCLVIGVRGRIPLADRGQ